MSSLPTAAMGLVIVFVDAGAGGWDWVADPVGWVLVLLGLAPAKDRLPAYAGLSGSAWVCLAVSVLTLPADSIDTIDPTLGWLFSLPTIAFCFLLCDSLADVTDGSLAFRFRWLRIVYAVVAVLPGLVFLGGLEWLTIPSAVVAVLANITLVLSVWAAGDEEDEEGAWRRERSRRTDTTKAPASKSQSASKQQARSKPTEGGKRKKQEQGFSAEEVRRRARARRQREESAREE